MTTDPVNLLPTLYRAPLDKTQWTAFLCQLSEVIPTRTADLTALDEQAKRCSLMLHWGPPQQYEDEYARTGSLFSPSGGNGHNANGPGNRTHPFIAEELLCKTELCNHFFLRVGPFRRRMALSGRAGRALGTLSLRRRSEDPPFGEPDLQVMHLLAPHVLQAIRLDDEFRQLRTRSQAKSRVLDQLPPGVAFLDETGRVLETDAQAAAILLRGDGIRMSKGRLRTTNAREDRRLQRAITQVCHKSVAEDSGILLSREAQAPLQIVVGPCCAEVSAVTGSPVAVVFINDTDVGMRPRFELLKELYRLTPAEARLACLMLDGKSAEQITGILGISRNTLKTQTKSIFAKTNVHRQSQLMRLLLFLPTERRSHHRGG